MKKQQKLLLLVLLCSILLLPQMAGAEETVTEPKQVCVAALKVPGLLELNKNGQYEGVIVDYLNEIAKYTGWEYVYVPLDHLGEVDLSLNGNCDLIGGMYYVEGLQSKYAYAQYNMGYSEAVLLARQDDTSIKHYDLDTLNGKVIGVNENAADKIERLQLFLQAKGLNCRLRPYTTQELKENGLVSFLLNGEVDLVLGNHTDLQQQQAVNAVASFDAQPYYLATSPEKQDILQQLNLALEKVLDSDPDFAERCYQEHFSEKDTFYTELDEQEKGYVAQKQFVTVAVASDWHPFYCARQRDGYHSGLVPDFFDKISEMTGLTFQFIETDNYLEMLRLVQEGKADVMGFYLGTEEQAQKQGVVLTDSFYTGENGVVRNKAVNYPDTDLTVAVVNARELPPEIKAAHVKRYETTKDALQAVNKGQADFYYGFYPRIEYMLMNYTMTNVVPVSTGDIQFDVRFALKAPTNSSLLTILNTSLNSMSAQEKEAIIEHNQMSVRRTAISIRDFIYANPTKFIAVMFGIFFALVIVAIILVRLYVRSVETKKDLELAQAESRAKGEFLSRMSHEIRTPMNAIVGMVDVVCMQQNIPADVAEHLQKIRSSACYLTTLINDILDMSRIEKGMLQIGEEFFSLKQILEEVQTLLATDAQLRRITFDLQIVVQHDGLLGDVVRLKQVLTNLLSNALKFTGEGGSVTLKATETTSDEQHCAILFAVTDTGSGIALEDQKRIFEAFEQSGSSYERSRGTGLGLPISKSIVEQMGGQLEVQSRLGEGSTFYFTVVFPLGNQERQEKVLPENALQNICVLLAEDNDLNAEIAISLLELQQAKVDRVSHGKMAVEKFAASAEGTYQVILMDIRMPEMSGLEAAKCIRQMQRADAAIVPIIAMTANSFQQDIDAAYTAGMNGFLTKPLDVAQLYQTVAKAAQKESCL